MAQWVKDSALSLLWLRFGYWPRNVTSCGNDKKKQTNNNNNKKKKPT